MEKIGDLFIFIDGFILVRDKVDPDPIPETLGTV